MGRVDALSTNQLRSHLTFTIAKMQKNTVKKIHIDGSLGDQALCKISDGNMIYGVRNKEEKNLRGCSVNEK